MQKQSFSYDGYSVIVKEAVNGGNSARVFVPKTWTGKKIAVILLEDLEEK